MKKPFLNPSLIVIVLILAALTVTACAGSGGSPSEEPTSAPVGQEPMPVPDMSISRDILLDPANATVSDSLLIIDYLYEGLVSLESDAIVPALAESWSVSNDGLDYIFNLRPNVTFHDGSVLNADAVIANFDRWFDKDNPAHASGEFAAWAALFAGFKGETDQNGQPKSNYDGIEKVNDFTVLIHLNKPDDHFLAKLVNPAFSIVAPSAFNADYFGTSLGKAIGTGMHMLKEWGQGSLILEPFLAYWNGIPSDSLEFHFR